MVTFITLNVYAQVGSCAAFYPLFKDPHKSANIDTPIVKTFKVLFQGQGLIMPILRLSEPYFYQIVGQKFKSIFFTCRRQDTNYDVRFLERQLDIEDAIASTKSIQESEEKSRVESEDLPILALKVEEEEKMAPLFYFLASSLNVELVYIILKSITKFDKSYHKNDMMSSSTSSV